MSEAMDGVCARCGSAIGRTLDEIEAHYALKHPEELAEFQAGREVVEKQLDAWFKAMQARHG